MSKERRDEDYVRFCKNWEKIFERLDADGSGGDFETMPPLKKGHRPAVCKSGEAVKAKVKGS